MQQLKELSERALQVAETTEKHCDMDALDKYYSPYNLWLRYSPIPSRPILETAWFESSVLAETSVFLAVHGFYEQACATLRMQLDGFLIRLYWDTLDKMEELESHPKVIRINSDYWEWESGKADDYPKSKEVWQTLSENENFNAFDKRYMLKEEISNQTQLLHKFIHGRPPTRHYPGATRSGKINVRFEKRHFDEWFVLFKGSYQLMTIVSVLLYPEYLKRPSWREFIMLEPERLSQINSIVGIDNIA